MTGRGPYSRVYWSIVDDPLFDGVFGDDRLLGLWVRMLLLADATWPASAPLPPKSASLQRLIDANIVIRKNGSRYSIRGLDAERERRSTAGRKGAAVRWQSERNAVPMLDETRRDKKRSGANAPKNGSHDGQHPNCAVCEATT